MPPLVCAAGLPGILLEKRPQHGKDGQQTKNSTNPKPQRLKDEERKAHAPTSLRLAS
jgi:hypothetical protein